MSAVQNTLHGRHYLLLAGVSIGGLLAPLNSTMIAVALPDLREQFGVSHSEIGWLVSAYLIAMAVAQPIGGRLSDQLGRSRVFRAGLVVFLGFSIAAALSPTFLVLVIFRTGQAIAGAVLIPNGMAMLRDVVPTHQLGRTNGLFGSVMGISAATGPLLGAALLGAGSWRLLFLVNVPVVAIALMLLVWIPYRDNPTQDRPTLDWVGSLLLAASLATGTFLLGSIQGGRSASVMSVAIALQIGLGVLFVRSQFGAPTIVQWQLFRNRAFAGATSYVLFTNLVMYTTLLTIPFFIREVQEKSSTQAGLLLGAMALLMASIAPIGGRVSDAIGRRWLAMAGAGIALIGTLLILFGIDEDVSFSYLAISLAILGLGLGMGFGAASTAAIESAPRAIAGSAAGTNSMMRYTGSILGAGILAAVLSTDGASVPDIGVFRVVLAIVAIFAVLAIVASIFVHRFPPEEDADLDDTVVADRAPATWQRVD